MIRLTLVVPTRSRTRGHIHDAFSLSLFLSFFILPFFFLLLCGLKSSGCILIYGKKNKEMYSFSLSPFPSGMKKKMGKKESRDWKSKAEKASLKPGFVGKAGDERRLSVFFCAGITSLARYGFRSKKGVQRLNYNRTRSCAMPSLRDVCVCVCICVDRRGGGRREKEKIKYWADSHIHQYLIFVLVRGFWC